jgi:hypothetical protein
MEVVPFAFRDPEDDDLHLPFTAADGKFDKVSRRKGKCSFPRWACASLALITLPLILTSTSLDARLRVHDVLSAKKHTLDFSPPEPSSGLSFRPSHLSVDAGRPFRVRELRRANEELRCKIREFSVKRAEAHARWRARKRKLEGLRGTPQEHQRRLYSPHASSWRARAPSVYLRHAAKRMLEILSAGNTRKPRPRLLRGARHAVDRHEGHKS